VKSKFERRGTVKFTTKGGLDLHQELAKLANGRSAFSGSLEKKVRVSWAQLSGGDETLTRRNASPS
jgi:hypothetical protein